MLAKHLNKFNKEKKHLTLHSFDVFSQILWCRAIHGQFQSDVPFLTSGHGSSAAAALVSAGTHNTVLRLLVSSGLKSHGR